MRLFTVDFRKGVEHNHEVQTAKLVRRKEAKEYYKAEAVSLPKRLK